MSISTPTRCSEIKNDESGQTEAAQVETKIEQATWVLSKPG